MIEIQARIVPIVGIITLGWVLTSAINAYSSIDRFSATIENVEQIAKGKQRFIVCDIDKKGRYTHTLLCDDVRKDDEKQTVTARCIETGEYYIFSYPCIVKDVTFTSDYIEYNRSH